MSVMEAAIATPSMLIQNYSYLGEVRGAGGRQFVMDGMHLPTRDGEVTLTTAGTGGRTDGVWAEFLGEPRLLDPKFATRASRNDNWQEWRIRCTKSSSGTTSTSCAKPWRADS